MYNEVKPLEPAEMIIYQSNTYRKDLSWLYFDDEPRVQERQQKKDQKSYITAFLTAFRSSSNTSK